MDMLATKTYSAPGLVLDRHRPRSGHIAGTDDPIPGAYHGYDRFGRIRTQMWYTPDAGGVFNDAARPALVELAYSYDKDHNVTGRHDVRAGRSVNPLTPGDTFAYDGLDRLTGRLGAVAESWSLDALGNWLGHARGVATEERSFNKANELLTRSIPDATTPIVSLLHDYDAAGNRVRRDAEAASGGVDNWLYTYDAWNRLVRASFAPGGDTANAVVRAEYTYNGLHQRATRRAAADTALGLAASDAGNTYYYDSAWRLCEERAATHWDGAAEFTPAKITQRFWCPLYIDALIATQTDTTGADPGPGADGDFTDAIFENTLYAACDRKYDVIAMTDADGNLVERTEYSPYGVARHRPPADLNGDGKIDGVDQLILFNAWGASLGSGVYNPDADINFDGQVNGSDFLILSNNFGADPAPPGAISKLGNTVGYSGYIYDDAIGMSLARFRWFDAETGRWATRDPLEYIDGHNRYEYIKSSPLTFTDPFGLSPVLDFGPIAPEYQPRDLWDWDQYSRPNSIFDYIPPTPPGAWMPIRDDVIVLFPLSNAGALCSGPCSAAVIRREKFVPLPKRPSNIIDFLKDGQCSTAPNRERDSVLPWPSGKTGTPGILVRQPGGSCCCQIQTDTSIGCYKLPMKITPLIPGPRGPVRPRIPLPMPTPIRTLL